MEKDLEYQMEHLHPKGNATETSPRGGKIERQRWSSSLDFVVICIGSAVGIGNMWRFPYLCYKNGGGVFLIPYFISVIFAGIPLVFLETAIGQFTSSGPIGAWKLCPLYKGYGYTTMIHVFLIGVSYNIVIGWSLRYLFASMTTELPWGSCNNTWNSPNCESIYGSNSTNTSLSATDSVTEYWEYNVLQLTDGIDNLGTIRWDLVLCVLLAWIIVFVCLWQGIKVTGKILYITTLGPYLLIFALLIRVATLDGSLIGVKYYLSPNWSKLMDMTVWVDAGTQVFWSTAVGIGILTTIGSYNTFNRNCLRASLITIAVNSCTSFVVGFVIFMTLGNMSMRSGIDISKVAESGPGLAFIAYPRALLQLPLAPVWAVCFFLIVVMVGMSSQIIHVESFNSCMTDIWPKLQQGRKNRIIIVASTCIVMFLLGLPCVTQGGMYYLQLLDYYVASRTILFTSCIQCLIISYVYGGNRFLNNIKKMFDMPIDLFYRVMWGGITPIFLFCIFVMNIIVYSKFSYRRGTTKEIYEYPSWSLVLGWTIAMGPPLLIPIVTIYLFATAEGSFMERFQSLRRKTFSKKGHSFHS